MISTTSKPRIRRSSKWPALRRRFLKGKVCAVCGRKKGLQAHHIEPVHVAPHRELDETNLVPLCEGNGVDCHLLFGHLGNWKSWNVHVRHDVHVWDHRLRARP